MKKIRTVDSFGNIINRGDNVAYYNSGFAVGIVARTTPKYVIFEAAEGRTYQPRSHVKKCIKVFITPTQVVGKAPSDEYREAYERSKLEATAVVISTTLTARWAEEPLASAKAVRSLESYTSL